MKHLWRQAGDREVGDDGSDVLGGVGAVWPVPVRRPVDRTEERAGCDARVRRAELTAAHAAGDERPHAALVAIALGDDGGAEAAGQSVELEVRRRPLELLDQTEHVGGGELAQPRRQRTAQPPRRSERGVQAVQRLVLTEVEELVLAAEVVIEVAGREVGGDGDVAHARRGEAALAEDARGGFQDLHAPGVGPARTTVRKLNHRSILAPPGP
jgi:hypothetical protein